MAVARDRLHLPSARTGDKPNQLLGYSARLPQPLAERFVDMSFAHRRASATARRSIAGRSVESARSQLRELLQRLSSELPPLLLIPTLPRSGINEPAPCE